jgi:hypothetical protein|tara:strand:+ start:418 stop:903 length:486 start_codon:yes stop_codon:yes gene_type:complete
MTTYISIATLALLIYLYINSKNDFFSLPKKILDEKWLEIESNCLKKGRSEKDIAIYKKAYDYYRYNPNQYDGATFVVDLFTVKFWYEGKVKKLGIANVKHDWSWQYGGANRNFIKNWSSNWEYFEDLRRDGKGVKVERLVALMIIGTLVVPFFYIKYKLTR